MNASLPSVFLKFLVRSAMIEISKYKWALLLFCRSGFSVLHLLLPLFFPPDIFWNDALMLCDKHSISWALTVIVFSIFFKKRMIEHWFATFTSFGLLFCSAVALVDDVIYSFLLFFWFWSLDLLIWSGLIRITK